MRLIIEAGRLFLNLIYWFFKRKKTENKVTLISRQDDTPSVDFLLIAEEYSKLSNPPKVNILTKKIPSGLMGKFAYLYYMIFTMMREIATSKAVILDGYCIPISLLNHKEDLVVIQMWHAMGALKKFAYSIVGQKEGSSKKVADLMRMHCGYDYIFASSMSCVPHLAEAYNYDEEVFVVKPLPRVDLIVDEARTSAIRKGLFEEYGFLGNGKKNILYSPTFRKDDVDFEYVYSLIDAIDKEKFNLVIAPHPLMRGRVKSSEAYIIENHPSLEIMSVCDYIISDYSAFIFEAAISKKPIFLYVPDREKYIDNRGFYIDLEAEDFCVISQDPNRIYDAILNEQCDISKVYEFASKFVEVSKDNTRDIIEFIEEVTC